MAPGAGRNWLLPRGPRGPKIPGRDHAGRTAVNESFSAQVRGPSATLPRGYLWLIPGLVRGCGCRAVDRGTGDQRPQAADVVRRLGPVRDPDRLLACRWGCWRPRGISRSGRTRAACGSGSEPRASDRRCAGCRCGGRKCSRSRSGAAGTARGLEIAPGPAARITRRRGRGPSGPADGRDAAHAVRSRPRHARPDLPARRSAALRRADLRPVGRGTAVRAGATGAPRHGGRRRAAPQRAPRPAAPGHRA